MYRGEGRGEDSVHLCTPCRVENMGEMQHSFILSFPMSQRGTNKEHHERISLSFFLFFTSSHWNVQPGNTTTNTTNHTSRIPHNDDERKMQIISCNMAISNTIQSQRRMQNEAHGRSENMHVIYRHDGNAHESKEVQTKNIKSASLSHSFLFFFYIITPERTYWKHHHQQQPTTRQE